MYIEKEEGSGGLPKGRMTVLDGVHVDMYFSDTN
jgi:hypothetical protein